eukprot:COSAG01_NODE_6395_length_3693_cov_2.142181_4_plen_58_part_00
MELPTGLLVSAVTSKLKFSSDVPEIDRLRRTQQLKLRTNATRVAHTAKRSDDTSRSD